MNIATGNLAIVDGKVFWKGQEIPVETLFLHFDGDTKLIKFEVLPTIDPLVLMEINAAGIRVRVLK